MATVDSVSDLLAQLESELGGLSDDELKLALELLASGLTVQEIISRIKRRRDRMRDASLSVCSRRAEPKSESSIRAPRV